MVGFMPIAAQMLARRPRRFNDLIQSSKTIDHPPNGSPMIAAKSIGVIIISLNGIHPPLHQS
ncbi:hypothetical protein JCGZ_04200 [Jatropha curcas]|uniref:Uncharacterized protein n=1 Tax=Jatropha curcas TaxID=180498 RepID=A0A067J9W1_JATCU|nr:hypothetical protein JCGZ_04200 [Jatropha curcas]